VRDYFAEVAKDPETVIREVRRLADEDQVSAGGMAASVLDQCVRDAVLELWDGKVRTFVPLLAMRRVRSCVRAGGCNATES